ncbi:MAG: lycopene cyclase domain-containing protein [Nanoarchaeota archaeon]|nr:lycopene cyclase domain-containing protein [Nanoarchaeota archaeon]
MNPWLISSLMLFAAWLIIFIFFKKTKKEMFWVSLFTMPLGLTEPLFVPEYWSPPSLFNLAAKTGFDIESLIFAFSMGGIASILYEIIFKVKHKKMSKHEMHSKRHRFHLLVLFSPLIVFVFSEIIFNFNIIYSVILALFTGSLIYLLCRPDLKNKVFVGGFLFLILYFIFFLFFNLLFQGWVEKTWNLSVISGILFLGIPIEELIFAFGVGMLWSSIYEHVKWYKLKR